MTQTPKAPRVVVGIDLAGSLRRPTGVCSLRGLTITDYATVFSDEDLLAFVERARPEVIGVDAPLSLPRGRVSLEDRNSEHLRACDRELLRRRIPFFPLTLGPMRSLTARGMRLKPVLETWGAAVIEIYPGGAQDFWGVGRKQKGLESLHDGLEKLGLKGLGEGMNGDELDAATGALVAREYRLGRAEALGDAGEGLIVLPKCFPRSRVRRNPS